MTVSQDTIATLRGISPPLAKALEERPELADGVGPDASVSAKVLAALVSVAIAEFIEHEDLATTTLSLSASLDAVVAEELAAVVEAVADRHEVARDLPFAVMAMGKWGAREINYYSDIDLVFVHDAVPGRDTESRAAALAIASRLLSSLSAPTFDGPTLNVDADLRPEGSMGPLSRSLDGYDSYYQRWGEPWELQALLKARHAAGDEDVGGRFRAMADRIIWDEGLDVEALRSIRALKARAEDEAKSGDIKRGRGGIRDVEFSVQILQMVHGRADESLRVTATLDAIAALHASGYIEEDDAEKMAAAYRFLRNVEHRLQLRELRQTHLIPPEGHDWLGRSLGFKGDPAEEFARTLSEVRQTVRDLHERLYFRPILDALVGLETAALTPEGAALRLEALGFRQLVDARRTVSELVSGVNRRAQVMRQVMPLVLDWLSQSPDPDLGLAQLRLLLAHSSDHAALIRTLQTNPVAGERLSTLLGTGKLVGDLIDRIPEFVPRLSDDRLITTVRDREEATRRLMGILDARPDREDRIGTIRRFVRRRKLRIAARDILGMASPTETLASLSDSADAAVAGALHTSEVYDGGVAVIAMGRWGGNELSYGSDIDVMYVHDDGRKKPGFALAGDLNSILSEPNRHGEAYRVDADLRPEGRKGPLSRSLDSYRRYYEEWVAPWELLALVKARPGGGDSELLSRYFEMLEPVVWRPALDRSIVNEIRAIKARVESERIPAGEDPDFHLKLGPGGLSDVEFATQLLQLRNGGEIPELQVTGTFAALEALKDTGLLTASDHKALHDAYLFCTRVRLRLHLQSGRPSDSLPVKNEENARLAASLGLDRAGELREMYRRYTRRARRVFESIFYD